MYSVACEFLVFLKVCLLFYLQLTQNHPLHWQYFPHLLKISFVILFVLNGGKCFEDFIYIIFIEYILCAIIVSKEIKKIKGRFFFSFRVIKIIGHPSIERENYTQTLHTKHITDTIKYKNRWKIRNQSKIFISKIELLFGFRLGIKK